MREQFNYVYWKRRTLIDYIVTLGIASIGLLIGLVNIFFGVAKFNIAAIAFLVIAGYYILYFKKVQIAIQCDRNDYSVVRIRGKSKSHTVIKFETVHIIAVGKYFEYVKNQNRYPSEVVLQMERDREAEDCYFIYIHKQNRKIVLILNLNDDFSAKLTAYASSIGKSS